MAVQMSVRANDSKVSEGVLKGFIGHIIDLPEPIEERHQSWGNMQVLPNYIIVEIQDISKPNVDKYLDQLIKTFEYAVTNLGDGVKQIILSINPAIVNVLGETSGLKQDIKDFIVEKGGVIITHSASSVTFNLTIENDALLDLKAEFKDIFEDVVSQRKYMFSEAGVNIGIAAGGFISVTNSQALNYIVDRSA